MNNFPPTMLQKHAHVAGCYSELLPDGFERLSAAEPSYFRNICRRQLNRLASFCSRIEHVVIMRPYEKMLRINAGWIVAMVANEHSCRNASVGEFVGDAVCPVLPTLNGKRAVTTGKLTSRPLSAAARTCHGISVESIAKAIESASPSCVLTTLIAAIRCTLSRRRLLRWVCSTAPLTTFHKHILSGYALA